MTATRHEVHLARVDAAARCLYEAQVGPWDEAELNVQDAWRWTAEQALEAARTAAGRTKSRSRRH